MFRAFIVSTIALMLCVSSAQFAHAADVGIDGSPGVECWSVPEGSEGSAARATNPSGPISAPTEVPFERAPDPIQALPGSGPLVADLPIVSQTVRTYTEGGLTHTKRTTVQRGMPRGMTSVSPSNGGRLAAPLSGVCTWTGRTTTTDDHTICGGGCITQYLQRIVDTYSNNEDPTNIYYDRIEVRLWWTRLYDDGINFNGLANVKWEEFGAFDCNGSPADRTTYSQFAPQWYTWDRTYDYYWDETWLPTVSTPGVWSLYLWNSTPTTFGTNLYTDVRFV